MKKAFTLAEIMIVLVVIGVITGILIPIAAQSLPNENVMKFKKAHTTLGNVIRELVNSDKYYMDGDLGLKPDGTLINNNDCGYGEVIAESSNCSYFCNTVADILSTKSVNCYSRNTNYSGAVDLRYGRMFNNNFGDRTAVKITPELLNKSKIELDDACKTHISVNAIDNTVSNEYYNANVQIVLTDNIYLWEANPAGTFGLIHGNVRRHSPPSQNPANFPDENGFDTIYKVVCIDVDGVSSDGNENCDDIKDVCPFGYGIRADGKILTGARADEWLEKSMQKEKK